MRLHGPLSFTGQVRSTESLRDPSCPSSDFVEFPNSRSD